jgi:hypothetical protein
MVAATDSCSHRRQARAQSGGGAQRNGGELGTRDDGLQEEEGLQRKQHQDEVDSAYLLPSSVFIYLLPLLPSIDCYCAHSFLLFILAEVSVLISIFSN